MEISVNSYHHQGVKKFSQRFVPMAFSPNGLVEGFYYLDAYNPAEGCTRFHWCFSMADGCGTIDSKSSDGKEDDDSVVIHVDDFSKTGRITFACDDGCVQIYTISDKKNLSYKRSLPRVSGEATAPKSYSTISDYCFGISIVTVLMIAERTLSVTWSSDVERIFSGSSDNSCGSQIEVPPSPVFAQSVVAHPAMFVEEQKMLVRFIKLAPPRFSGELSEDAYELIYSKYKLNNLGLVETCGMEYTAFQLDLVARHWWRGHLGSKPPRSPPLTWT
ncbi:hypothetical protein T459_21527 [Capsicum annuum]|uniref:Uncharacterized protein n=1 Tax=Capsicum annuum TaxID=4072 RepID=A0A2G2YWV1_CAPAN|nr:hypothetical protein T459_21527 [Capsicum annuum]